MDLKYWLFYILCGLSFLGSACQRQTTTLDTLIPVKSDLAFEEWLHRIQDDFSTEVITEITESRQQIRFQVMTEETGLESKESQKRVYARITGQSIRQLIIHGYELKAESEQNLINVAEDYFLRIKDRISRTTDSERKGKLESAIKTVTKRIETHREKLKAYETRLTTLREDSP